VEVDVVEQAMAPLIKGVSWENDEAAVGVWQNVVLQVKDEAFKRCEEEKVRGRWVEVVAVGGGVCGL